MMFIKHKGEASIADGREKKWKAQTRADGFFLLGAPPSRRQHLHENQCLGFGYDGAGETPSAPEKKTPSPGLNTSSPIFSHDLPDVNFFCTQVPALKGRQGPVQRTGPAVGEWKMEQ